jgi:hypothetical protein
MDYRNGDRHLTYPNGAEITYHNKMKFIRFPNNDRACQFPDGAKAYRFEKTQTLELTLPDGTKITQFITGRREHLDPAGQLTVTYHCHPKIPKQKGR